MIGYANIFTIIAAALYDVAFAATAGILLCRLWLDNSTPPELTYKLHRCLILTTAAMLLVLPLQIFLLAVSMTGSGSWQMAWSALPDVVSAHAGHTLLLSLYIVPILLLSAFFSRNSSPLTRIQLALLVLITVFRSAYGHAASDGDFTLHEIVQFFHLSSIATWAGGVLIAGLIVNPTLIKLNRHDQFVQFAKRLSGTITIALIIVVLSGLYNAWQGLGHSLAPLPHTAWGKMLLLKVAVVLLAFAHGARCRVCLQSTDATERTPTIHQWMRREAILMLLVLILSAWLANMPPADMESSVAPISPHSNT